VTAQATPSRATAAQAAPGSVLSSEAVGPDIVVLRLARPAGFRFQAGQALKLGLAGGGNSRPYTIASPPSAEHLEFCIERIASGNLSPRLTNLQPGARVELAVAAKGSLTFNAAASVHLMLATATGIAPFRSMLLELLRAPTPSRRIVLLHGASYADRLPYLDELSGLARRYPDVLTYVATVSRPSEPRNAGWSGQTGRVDTFIASFLQLADEAARPLQAYACGNSAMIESSRQLLALHGLSLKSEAFD
jgi:ferredoxin--NADP+ reductase